MRFPGDFAIRPGRSVLFVDSQGLGDVVQSLPLLRAVCRWTDGRWPVQSLFATPDHYELVREESLNLTPLFVSSVPRNPYFVFRLWSKLIGKPDLIVCAPEMSAAKLVALKYATAARYAIGEASAPYSRFLTSYVETSWTRPWVETQDAIAAALGLETPLEPPSICVTKREQEWAESMLAQAGNSQNRRILGIQCSSAVPQKRWPSESFAQVLKEIHRRHPDLRVISFGTAMERSSADQTRCIAGKVPWVEGAGKWTIRRTLAMLSCCSVFLSGDTGLMHMAAALGVPTVSIFGPTSATRRAPLHNDGFAICPVTSCHPCFRGAWTPCECIRSITPVRVIEAVETCLAGPNEAGCLRFSTDMETIGSVRN